MNPPFIIHIACMILATALILTGAIIAHRRNKGWLRPHKMVAITGVIFAVSAGAVIIGYKNSIGFPHFQSPHAIAGVVGLCLVLLTPLLGVLISPKFKFIRPLHRILGRVTGIGIGVVMVSGIFRAVQLFLR